jgi:hypothetical protein
MSRDKRDVRIWNLLRTSPASGLHQPAPGRRVGGHPPEHRPGRPRSALQEARTVCPSCPVHPAQRTSLHPGAVSTIEERPQLQERAGRLHHLPDARARRRAHPRGRGIPDTPSDPGRAPGLAAASQAPRRPEPPRTRPRQRQPKRNPQARPRRRRICRSDRPPPRNHQQRHPGTPPRPPGACRSSRRRPPAPGALRHLPRAALGPPPRAGTLPHQDRAAHRLQQNRHQGSRPALTAYCWTRSPSPL